MWFRRKSHYETNAFLATEYILFLTFQRNYRWSSYPLKSFPRIDFSVFSTGFPNVNFCSWSIGGQLWQYVFSIWLETHEWKPITISMWLHGRSEQCVSSPQYCVSTQTQQEEGIISYNYAQKRKQNEQTEVTSSSPVLLIRTGKNIGESSWFCFLIKGLNIM